MSYSANADEINNHYRFLVELSFITVLFVVDGIID